MAKILLSLPDDLLKRFDSYAEKKNYERSELMRKLIRDVVYDADTPLEVTVDVPPEMKREYVGTMPPKIESIKSIEEPEKAHGEEWGYCEGHYQKGTKYERKLVTVEDNNGTEVLTRKWLCPRCIEKLEANVGNYGGHIDYL